MRVEGSQEPRRGDAHEGDLIRQLQGAALTESPQFLLPEAARIEAMSEGVLIAGRGTAFGFHLHSLSRSLPKFTEHLFYCQGRMNSPCRLEGRRAI
jgi:hypothetical protein